MQINFYEEYPTKENLDKLRLVNFPTKIFIAAKSLREFEDLERKVKKIKKDAEVAYWPIVKNSYWISPFSNTCDLVRLFRELEKFEGHMLIDLEFPVLNKEMILKNLFSFWRNKKLIMNFLEKNKARITTAQAPPVLGWGFRRVFGLDYDIKLEKGLMFYTSTLKQNHVYSLLVGRIKGLLRGIEDKKNYNIGLGIIAKGVLTTEAILTPKDLKKDLEFMKNAGFEKVVIFRLGGLNKDYVSVIKKFLK